MEEASLGEWEQRVVISLELSGKAELGGQTELQGQPCAIRGEVQVDGNRQRGSTPGGPEGRGPRRRGGPRWVSASSAPRVSLALAPAGGLALPFSSPWVEIPLRPKSPPSCFHSPVGDAHPDVASSHPTRASIPPWNPHPAAPAPSPKARASRVDPPSPAPGLAPRLGGNQEPQVQELTAQSFVSHHSGGGQCEIGVRAGLVPPEASLLGV